MAQALLHKTSKPQSVAAPIRAAVYARHSSSKQNPRSCDEQIAHIQYLVGKGDVSSKLYSDHSIEIISEWIIKDEAISGRSASREGYQIITDALSSRDCPFQIIIVDDLTRLNRDLGNTLHFYQLALFAGVEILSVSDSLSSADPNAKTFFTVKGMVGDLGNEAHAMRTIRGMEMKALKGFSCGSKPYGYKSEATSIAKEGGRDVARDFRIFIDESEAKIVRRIFKMFVEGHGRSAICRMLNEDKIPWPGFNSAISRGKGWSPTTVYKILTNPRYIGIWTWKKTKCVVNPQTGQKVSKAHPENEWVSYHEGEKNREDLRIVSQSLWNKAQEMFEEIHKHHGSHGNWGRYRNSVPLHMLSGLLKCSACSGAMVICSGHKGGFYGCSAAKVKGTCSQQKLIRRAKLERVIINFVTEQIQDEALFQEATQHYNRLMNEKLSKGRENFALYEEELASIEIELKHAAEAVMQGGNSETLTKAMECGRKVGMDELTS